MTRTHIAKLVFAALAIAPVLGLIACDTEPANDDGGAGESCNAVASCNLHGMAPSVSGEVSGICHEHTGSMWTADIVEAGCPESVGAFSEGCCPRGEDAIARCIIAPGALNERVDYYYASKGYSLEEAEEICASTNTGNNVFEVLVPGSSGNGGSGGEGQGGAGGGSSQATCESLCNAIAGDCASDYQACLDECVNDEGNAASCDQEVEWQAMLDCCELVDDYAPYCGEGGFDPCQKGACEELRPSGAAAGCT